MPSATTAESRLSTAASSATVKAEGSRGRMARSETRGTRSAEDLAECPRSFCRWFQQGKDGREPRQRLSAAARQSNRERACVTRGQNRMIASDPAATAAVGQRRVPAWAKQLSMRTRNSLGTAACQAEKVFDLRGSDQSAMPLVKPIVTGRGIIGRPCPVRSRP